MPSMMPGILSTVGPFLGSLCPVILALIAVGRLGSAEPPDVPTGWKDVEALGAPTRCSVDVEPLSLWYHRRAQLGVLSHPPASGDARDRDVRIKLPGAGRAGVEHAQHRPATGQPLGQHGHAPTGRRERHAQHEDPAAGRAARQGKLAGSSRVWYTPGRLFPSIGNFRCDDFQ